MVSFVLFLLRYALSLRYRITVKGLNELKYTQKDKRGILFLANHPAETDPIILTTLLWPRFKVRPVAAEFVFLIPFIRFCVSKVGAIPIPAFDVSSNSFKKKRIEKTYEKIAQLLKEGENVLIYPAGLLKVGNEEVIGGASGTQEILNRAPEAHIVLIRTTGLWGSTFSKAITGKRPDLGECFIHGLKVILKNLIFFTPRRSVLIEIERAKDFPRGGEKREINQYLEEWFNARGAEPLKLVSFAFWKEEVPEVAKKKEKKFSLSAVPQEVQDKVLEEVSHLTKVPVEELAPELDFAQDLGLDSLDKAQLVLILREQFGVPDVPSNELITIESMMAYAAHLKKGTAELPKKAEKKSRWGKEKNRPVPSYPETETLIEGFLCTAEKMSKFLAAADMMSGEISYRQMRLGVILFALYLKKLPGERIGIMLPASIAADIAMLAVQLAGKIPVMINWTLGEKTLKSIVEQSKIDFTLSSWKFLDRLANIELGPLNDQLHLLEEIRFAFSFKEKLQALYLTMRKPKKIRQHFKIHQLTSGDWAVILFTSGTESIPKAVPLSHKNVIENQRSGAQLIRLSEDDVMFGILPPFHSFGFSVTGILPVISGLRVAYSPNPTMGRQIAMGIERWKATIFCSAPTFLKTVLRVAKKSQLRTLRLVITGAEKTQKELYEKMQELNPKTKMIEGYGITECGPILTLNRPDGVAKGVGKPLPGVELKIVHPETYEEKKVNEEGLILAAGPNIFSGYLGDIQSPFVEIDQKRWYDTGDLGVVDASGALSIVGRLKRFIKIGGEMVSLTMIEEELHNLGEEKGWKMAKDAPSFAIIALENGEEKASIHLFTVTSISKDEANKALREKGMSNLVKVQSVNKLSSIPLLGTGKTDYRALTKKLKEERVD